MLNENAALSPGSRPVVIFDLDGVIADSHPIHEAAWKALLRESGRDDLSHVADLIRAGESRADILRALFPDVPADRLDALGVRKDRLYSENASVLRPVPGVIPLIRRLKDKGALLAVATSAGQARTWDTLEVFGLKDVFDAVVTGSDVACTKPDPAVYLLAAERLGVVPREAIVVEDSVAGVRAAKSAGMRCIGYCADPGNRTLENAGADQVIRDFTKVDATCFF